MFEPTVKVSVSGKGLSDLSKFLEELSGLEVLVGVPEERAERPIKDKKGQKIGTEKITNAQLAFIHSNGSPLKGIPARPFIEPAITDSENLPILTEGMRQAAELAFAGKNGAAVNALKGVAMTAQNMVREWFTSPKNGWPPLDQSTIEARARRQYSIVNLKTEAAKARRLARRYAYIAFGEFRPLIDTGALRKAVQGLVARKGQREVVNTVDVTGGTEQ